MESVAQAYLGDSEINLDGFRVKKRRVGTSILPEVWQGDYRIIWKEEDLKERKTETYYTVKNHNTAHILNQIMQLLGRKPEFDTTKEMVKRRGKIQYGTHKYRLHDGGNTYEDVIFNFVNGISEME